MIQFIIVVSGRQAPWNITALKIEHGHTMYKIVFSMQVKAGEYLAYIANCPCSMFLYKYDSPFGLPRLLLQ